MHVITLFLLVVFTGILLSLRCCFQIQVRLWLWDAAEVGMVCLINLVIVIGGVKLLMIPLHRLVAQSKCWECILELGYFVILHNINYDMLLWHVECCWSWWIPLVGTRQWLQHFLHSLFGYIQCFQIPLVPSFKYLAIWWNHFLSVILLNCSNLRLCIKEGFRICISLEPNQLILILYQLLLFYTNLRYFGSSLLFQL